MPSSFVNMFPGVGAAVTANWKSLFTHRSETFLSQGRYIDGTKARDPSNTTDVGVLQPGLIMGKVTSGGLYAPSIYGLSNAAITNSALSVTLASTAIGTEIVRRKGATGTFKITGPPTAAGTVRTLTATYSAISTTTATITALGVNEVQRINFNIASTGGTVTLLVPHAAGDMISTTAASWNATDATYLANIQTVLDVATGVANGIVVSAISAVDTDLGFVLTYSGVGYAGLPQPMAEVTGTMPTSSTTWNSIRTTTGVDGRFVTGSLIQPVDGSETPLSFLPDWDAGIKVTDDLGASVATIDFPKMPTAGEVDASQLVNFPADTSTRTWLEGQLSNAYGGKFTFAGSSGVY